MKFTNIEENPKRCKLIVRYGDDINREYTVGYKKKIWRKWREK